ncbi:hypothetical protein ACFWX6_33135 [Amycolatopsis sp. NPDC059019]|uniref:RapZ C-terminal domain-containing protein n=1 Tax=unclassified Amycolatopsis TaxID=2618356 RepID=UPI00366A8269
MSVPPILCVISFGYLWSDPPVANAVLDLRWMPDPFTCAEFRDLSGRDTPVQRWLLSNDQVERWVDATMDTLCPQLGHAERRCSRATTWAFGCLGGVYRSSPSPNISPRRSAGRRGYASPSSTWTSTAGAALIRLRRGGDPVMAQATVAVTDIGDGHEHQVADSDFQVTRRCPFLPVLCG